MLPVAFGTVKKRGGLRRSSLNSIVRAGDGPNPGSLNFCLFWLKSY